MNEEIVAIYCRLSKEDENIGESESIQNQKSMLLAYALNKQWDVYNIYVDDDYSGTDNSRPQFNSMLNDAKNGNFNIILCKTQSRFSRDMAVIENYLHNKFIEWGIRFISIVDNADTNDKSNKKARQINSLINEWYIEDLSENIRAVFKNKMQKGEFLATYAPYGYQRDPIKKNHLIIDEYAARIVTMIYNLHFEGYGAQKIARILNEKNIPNPRKYKEMLNIRKTKMYADNEQGLWNTTTIGDILHNQTYCGDTVQNTQRKLSYKSEKRIRLPRSEWIIVENTHTPIIEREIFEQVQRNLSVKRRSTGTGEIHILSGKVICYYCKKTMQKTTSNSTQYLRCRNKYSLPSISKCQTPTVPINIIEHAIKNELTKLTESYTKNTPNIIINLHENNNSTKIKTIQTEISKYSNAIKNLYLDKISGIISEEQFNEFNTSFLKSKQNHEITLAKLSNTNKKQPCEQPLKTFMQSEPFTRNIINELIDFIEVGKVDEKTSEILISIHWKLCL